MVNPTPIPLPGPADQIKRPAPILRPARLDLPWIRATLLQRLTTIEKEYLLCRSPSLRLVAARLVQRANDLDKLARNHLENPPPPPAPRCFIDVDKPPETPYFASAYRTVARCLRDVHARMPALRREAETFVRQELECLMIANAIAWDKFKEMEALAVDVQPKFSVSEEEEEEEEEEEKQKGEKEAKERRYEDEDEDEDEDERNKWKGKGKEVV